MVYVPNPDDFTQPTDGILAETAQAEFRGIKGKLSALLSNLAVWNINDKAPDLSLTGGNLIASNATGVALAGTECVRATIPISVTNANYFEITIVKSSSPTITPIYIGVMPILGSLTAIIGTTINTGISINNGGILSPPDSSNGNFTVMLNFFSDGDTIGITTDPLNGLIYFTINGASIGFISVPLSLFTSGLGIYPFVGMQGEGNSVLANFGTSAFKYVPSIAASAISLPYIPSSGVRNIVINGRCEIDQQNGGTLQNPIVTTSQMTDCWAYEGSVAAKFQAAQNLNTVTPPLGYAYYQGLQSLTNYAVAAPDIFVAYQKVLGLDMNHLGWGFSGAKTATLLFFVFSDKIGVFSGSVSTGAGDASFVFSYRISQTLTWTPVAIVIPGPTIGTWSGTTANAAAIIRFDLGCGSNNRRATTGWNADNLVGLTGSVEVVSTINSIFFYCGVEFKDGVFTAGQISERTPWSLEFVRCLRRYARRNVWVGELATGGSGYSYPVPMRAVPTITGGAGGFTLLGSSGAGAWYYQTTGAMANLVFDARP